jgi:transcriptional regulator with XRE-family HTH domain
MERVSTIAPENVYFRYRKEAEKYNGKLSSRDGAAELLGMSPSTLANYELGITKVVPPDSVVLMAELYKAPELKGQYCVFECPIGKGAPVATQAKSIAQATVRMIKAFSQELAEEAKRKMVDIASDDEITEDKISQIEWMLGYLNGLALTISELRLVCEKLLVGIKNGES